MKKPKPIAPEDLDVANSISTTIQGILHDPDWVEKAAELVECAPRRHVKLDHGILTVKSD